MLDLLLVRWGPWLGCGLCLALAVLVGALRRRGVRQALQARLAGALVNDVARPSRGQPGEKVTLSGTLAPRREAEPSLEGHPGVLALTVRGEAGPLGSRAVPLVLRTTEGPVALEGELEVLAARDPAPVSPALQEEIGDPGTGWSGVHEHRVHAGERVRVCGVLERRSGDGYRGGASYVLRGAPSVSLAADPRVPLRSPLVAGTATGAVALCALLAAGFVASALARGPYVGASGRGRTHGAPLSWAHRVALLSPLRGAALAIFDDVERIDRSEPETMELVAAAARVRRGCGGELEVRVTHRLALPASPEDACDGDGALWALLAARADGRFDDASAIASAHEAELLASLRTAHRAELAVLPLAHLEAGRDADAARVLGRLAERGDLDALGCIGRALSAAAEGGTISDEGTDGACCLAARELERADAASWRRCASPTAELAALAAGGEAPEALELGVADGYALVASGRTPRWDGLVAHALDPALPPPSMAVDCALHDARATYRWRRFEAPPPVVAECPMTSARVVAALDAGDHPPELSPATELARLRVTRADSAYRALRDALRPTPEIWIREDEDSPIHVTEPLWPRERAAARGDGWALRLLLPPLVAVRLARGADRDGQLDDLRRRRRTLGAASAWALRDDALVDLWVERETGDGGAIADAEGRVDRIDAVLADRRRAVLEEAVLRAVGADVP